MKPNHRLSIRGLVMSASLFLISFLSHAQTIWSFNTSANTNNSCYVNVNWNASNFSCNQHQYAFVTRSIDNGATWYTIAIIVVPDPYYCTGSNWIYTYTDTNPYGNSSTVSSSGVQYRIYFIRDDGVKVYSTIAIASVPVSKGSCSGLSNPCTGIPTSISGPATVPVSTPTNYTVTSSAEVRWSISSSYPAGIATVSSSGPNNTFPNTWTATVNFTGSGSAKLTATFPVCGSSITIPICSGAPDWSKLSILTQGPTVCPNVPVGFGARYNGNCTDVGNANITSFTWNVSPIPTQIVYNTGTFGCTVDNNSSVTIKFPSSPTMYNVRISATNACGTSSLSDPLVVTFKPAGQCPPSPNGATAGTDTATAAAFFDGAGLSGATRFFVAPNPSSGQLLISLPASGSRAGGRLLMSVNKAVAPQPSIVKHIDVFNAVGVRVRSLHYGTGATGSLSVDLGDLSKGVYILTLTTDIGMINEKIAIVK